MSFSHIRSLFRSVLIIRRQYVTQKCSFTIDHTLRSKQASKEAKQTVKEDPKILSEDGKQRVLNFFNKCDFVALKRVAHSKKQFHHIDTATVIQHGTSDCRFQGMSDLLDVIKVTEEDLYKLDLCITKYQDMQSLAFGANNLKLKPKFIPSNVDITKIDTVVAIDVHQRFVLWSAQSVHNQKITDLGLKVLFDEKNFTFFYDHINHQQQISKLMQRIPEAQVYLLHNYIVNHRLPQGRAVKFELHQSIIQAILTTFLNNRLTQTAKNSSDSNLYLDTDDSMLDTDENRPQKDLNTNSVYLFEKQTIGKFYDLMVGREMKMLCNEFLNENYGQDDGPLKGLDLSHHSVGKVVKDLQGQEQLARCILMSDIFCKTLLKCKR